MKKEKIVLAFIAAIIGLLVAGIIFYIYESTKIVTPPKLTTIATVQEKTNPSKVSLTLSKPTDESVVESKVIQVSGKTKPDATIIILTSLDEKVIAPSSDGNFSATINIGDGQNLIEITAIARTGEQIKITKTVTFSTEKF